jgi:hypothetical protein
MAAPERGHSGLGVHGSPGLTPGAAEALPTRALLARLERLRWCEESATTSDLTDEEVASVRGLILFKSDEAWRVAYADIKDIFSRRDNVD